MLNMLVNHGVKNSDQNYEAEIQCLWKNSADTGLYANEKIEQDVVSEVDSSQIMRTFIY